MNSGNKIKAIMILEILGKPPEHLKNSLEKHIEKIKEEKGVDLIEKKIHDPRPTEKNKEIYTTFAEVEVEVAEILYLVRLMFKYMPSNIEIIEPETIALTNNGWSEVLSELVRKLHGYDEVARMLQNEKKILEKKLKEKSSENTGSK